jgi:ABC-type multidrug transport system ATPase subunit
MTEAAIVAEGLGKRYGPVTALDGVDLVLPAGGVLGLLGPNGAGKTTLVRILATLLRPDRGRARVAGFDVAQRPQAVRRLIGLSGQYASVDPFLTGEENLIMIGRLYGLPRRRARGRTGELIGQLGLDSAAGRLVRTYSGACGAAWMSPPACWPRRRSCSSTSRRPAWTRAADCRCGSCSAN